MAFWRKKPASAPTIASLLAVDNRTYVSFVADFIDQTDPGTRAHIAVAYQNFIPLISALHQVSCEENAPITVERFIEQIEGSVNGAADEINQRRFSWFMFAALVARLEKLARNGTSMIPMSATVWTVFATEYPRLKQVLPHNIVWKDEEKEWFDLSKSNLDLIELAVNHHIPPIFAGHGIVRQFARQMRLIYLPSKSRIGFIP